MNSFAHFFFNAIILSFFIPDINQFLLPIFVFSVIPDIDHLPGIIKYFQLRSAGKKIKRESFVDLFRTAIQEPIGVLTVCSILFSLFFFGINNILLIIAAACFFLHWLLDFLTVHTRPFDPYNKKVVILFFKTKKQRIQGGIVLTILFLLLFLFTLFV